MRRAAPKAPGAGRAAGDRQLAALALRPDATGLQTLAERTAGPRQMPRTHWFVDLVLRAWPSLTKAVSPTATRSPHGGSWWMNKMRHA